jgi:GNAT superfamily N-acetyltransferase
MIKLSQRDVGPETFIQKLKAEFKDITISLYYNDRRKELDLMALIVPKEKRGQGIGSQIMRKMTEYAKLNGLKIVLSPSIDFGASSKERLKKFYKGFGFVENKGRNKDFSISDTMYTKPNVVK